MSQRLAEWRRLLVAAVAAPDLEANHHLLLVHQKRLPSVQLPQLLQKILAFVILATSRLDHIEETYQRAGPGTWLFLPATLE